MPHPLVTICGFLVIGTWLIVLLKTDFVPRAVGVIIAAVMAIIFRAASRKSAQLMRERRERELEELRHARVLHLDD